jgi:uncharacterized protein
MLRQRFTDELKTAMKARDARSVSTLRLILAGLKDRDIAARAKGNMSGVGDDEIADLLNRMVRQRRESIALYEQGGRPELADQERAEIAVIERYMPRRMDEAALAEAVGVTIAALGATSVKDMGRVMAALKERYAGQIDFAAASALVKASLA